MEPTVPAQAAVADISAREARIAFDALEKRIGIRARIMVSLNAHSNKPLYASIYPYSLTRDAVASATAETFAELVNATEKAWTDQRIEIRAKTVASMALAVIRITDAVGACSDAALRAEFTREDVEDCGADACAKADTMAGRGPFVIVPAAKANVPSSFEDEAAA